MSDWSSDVCSSDLCGARSGVEAPAAAEPGARRSGRKRDMAHSRSARGRAKSASPRASARGDSSQGSSNTRTQRQLRVGEELRHALSALLARGELRDPHLAGVSLTVTEERVSPDLKKDRKSTRLNSSH